MAVFPEIGQVVSKNPARAHCHDPGNNDYLIMSICLTLKQEESLRLLKGLLLYISLPFGGCRCDTVFSLSWPLFLNGLSLDSTKAAHFTSQNALITR